MSRGRKLWIVGAGLAAIALLQLALISGQGLWADEVFSLAIATGHSLEHPAAVADAAKGDFVQPDHPVAATELRGYLSHESPPAGPARVVRAVLLSDTSPPLYYLLLYGWTVVLGTGDLQLRLFSMACFFACFPLLAAVGWNMGGRSAALMSCILFSLSPVSLYYSTEGRMYPLLWLCVLAIIWSSQALYQRRGSVGLLTFWWIVASAAGFLTHYFFVFPWLAIIALLAVRPGNFHRMRLVACMLATGVLILPWYLHIPESLGRWRITSHWLNWEPAGFNRLVASCKLALQFFGSSGRWTAFMSLLLFSVAFGVLLWRVRIRLCVWPRLIVWLTFAAACAGPVIFDFVRHTYTVAVPRYALAALPAAYLLGGLALTALRLPLRIVVLILIFGAWTPSIWSLYRDRTPWSSFRKIARAASVKNGPSDLILVHSIPSGVLGIARYADGPAAIASWVGQLGTQRVPQSLLRLAAGRKRILFVKVHQVKEPAPEEDWLRAHAVIAHEMHTRSGALIDFRPVNAVAF